MLVHTFHLLSPVVLSASTFMHNNASIGAAIYAGDKGCCQKHYGVSLIDVKVIENVCMPCTNDAKVR